MSQEQYNTLLSNLLNEKCTLAKLRVELEGRKGKLCRSCRGFGHLARNCRKEKKEEKGVATPQNKFEILSSRVMQCGVEERVVRSMRTIAVRCFKCGEEEHKCRECPLWERKVKRVARPEEGRAHQEKRRLVRPIRKKVQEGEKRLRSRGGRSGMHGQATRSTARMEKELDGRAQKESKRALWQRSAGESMVTRIGVVHPGNNSDLQQVQRMWKERKLCRR